MFLCVSLGRFSRVMRCVMKMPLRRVRVMGRSFVVPTVMMFRRLAMMTGGVIVVFRSLAVVFRSFLRHIYSPDYSVLSISGPGGGDARTIPRHQLLDVRGSSSQGGASYHFSTDYKIHPIDAPRLFSASSRSTKEESPVEFRE